jgi:SOS-response transcriptional repressor LexA
MGELLELKLPPRRNGRGLTIRQRRALRYIARTIEATGAWPSFDEIGTTLGLLSRGAIARTLTPLFERGLLTRPLATLKELNDAR